MKDVARRRLLDALVAITAERGLDRASMREVAAAAGVSIGTVQYYCRSKDEMLRMAFEYVIDRIIARVTAIPESDRAAHMLRHGVLEFLPLDELRRVEARVYLAFTARAAISPPLARLQHDLQTQMREKCTRAFALARQRGEAVADFDPEAAARATMAMVDGLMLHMLTDPAGMPADAAITVLDEHLHRFLNLEPIRPAHCSSGAEQPGPEASTPMASASKRGHHSAARGAGT